MNVEQAKNTILLVRGTAAEPAALSAFTAAQPDVQLQTISGLDEAGADRPALRRAGCAGTAPLRRAGGNGGGRLPAAGAAGGIRRGLAHTAEAWRVRHDVADGAGGSDPDAAQSAAAEKKYADHAGPDRPAALTLSLIHI